MGREERRLRYHLAALLALAPVLSLAAQDGLALKETRSFYQDVSGYHAQGQAQAADRAEAQRLAKAAALSRLFDEIGKDMIFAEMAISGWPEYITVEDSLSREQGGVVTSLAQVVVATSAIMLTEQKYQVAVAELLTRTEEALAVAETELAQADDHERNLRFAEALGSYRRARGRLAEARELTRDVGDKSVVSDQGSTIVALTTRLSALEIRVADGLGRVEAVERETLKSVAADEMTRAVDLYESEVRGVEEHSLRLEQKSPFYDLPRAELDAIQGDLAAELEKVGTIVTELEKLVSLMPEDSQYLRQKADLSLTDARAATARLSRMDGELKAEIKLPRLVRQERARRRRAVLDAMRAGLRYAFLHRPTDTVTLGWRLPLAWDMEGPIQSTGELDLDLEAEGVFGRGLWIRGSLGHDDVVDARGEDTWRSAAWGSSFDLGYGATTLLGLGVSWDWVRGVGPAEGPVTEGAERELGFRLHVGGMDAQRRRVSWLISLGYAVPMARAGAILIPYHLNLSLSTKIKAGDILILSAHVRTKSYQGSPLGDTFTDAFFYRFDWGAGVALRLPPPFVLGLEYGGQVTGRLSADGVRDADPHAGAWTLSLGYVF